MNMNFKSKTCTDGWIIVNQDQLVGNSVNNGHIVEVKLNADGTLNERELETFCGEALKGRVVWDGHIYRNNLEGRRALRNEMARLQNISEEFCGRCAAHLYLG